MAPKLTQTATSLSVPHLHLCAGPQWPYPLAWYDSNSCLGLTMMRDRKSDQWMHGAEILLDPMLRGLRGYVPLFSHVSFLSGLCGGTTHAQRMVQTMQTAFSHPCTSGSRIIVAHYWNLDDEVTFAAWPLLENATYVNGALHVGCRSEMQGASFTCHFKPTARSGWIPTEGQPPYGLVRVSMRRAIELPYVENSYCYRELQPTKQSESRRTIGFYFRGGINIFGAQGKRVRRAMLRLRLDEHLDAHITCTAHTNMKVGEPGCPSKVTSKETAAAEMYHSTFCLVPRGDTPDSSRLYDAIACGCIPIIISDRFHGAFPDAIDYARFTLRVTERDFLADPVGSLRRLTQNVNVTAFQSAMISEGVRVLYLHPHSRLSELLTGALTASHARAMKLTHYTSWY